MKTENRAKWERLHSSKHAQIEAYKDLKYGMFIHWGIFSVLAGEWKGMSIETVRPPHFTEWAMRCFEIPRDEYRKVASEFNPTGFAADDLVQLARDAGMKYLVITAKHHDGFAMFRTEASRFNVVDETPFGRDIVQELHDACERAGILFGVYYSHSIDWMDGGDGGQRDNPQMKIRQDGLPAYNHFDPAPVSFAEYLDTKAIPQMTELLTRYPGLLEVWFDVDFRIPDERSLEFYELVTRHAPGTLVNSRVGNGYGDYGVPGDNVIPTDSDGGTAWETPGTTNNSWGFQHFDHEWKEPAEILFWIIEIVSKGGNYLLNIGPRADGVVPAESANILRDVGQWLTANGAAIYGTRPWKVQREGPTVVKMSGSESRKSGGFSALFTASDFWFTSRGDTVYAITLAKPDGDTYLVSSLVGQRVSGVEGIGCEVTWRQTDAGLVIAPAGGTQFRYGRAFAVTILEE